jgi:hypothetical protein
VAERGPLDLLQISDLLDATKRQKLMYDDHNMTRSELYFTMDQLLRVFGDWTSDLVTDLRTLQQQILDNFVKNYRTDITISGLEPGVQSRQTLEPNWENLLRHAERSQTDVHTLVTQKQDEIRSLRDGVRLNPLNCMATVLITASILVVQYHTSPRIGQKHENESDYGDFHRRYNLVSATNLCGGKWSFREIWCTS